MKSHRQKGNELLKRRSDFNIDEGQNFNGDKDWSKVMTFIRFVLKQRWLSM